MKNKAETNANSDMDFLVYLPADAQSDIRQAVESCLNEEKGLLESAISSGVALLPAWMRSLAKNALR